MNKPPIHPYIILFIGVLSISTAAIFVKLAGDAPASIVAFFRLSLAVLIMSPYVLWKHFDEIKQINQKDWIMAVLLEPIGAAILAYWLLSEPVTWSQWLGGSIVLFGLMMFIFSTTKKVKPKITHAHQKQ